MPSVNLSDKIKTNSGSDKQLLVYYQDYVIVNKRTWKALSGWYPGLKSICSKIIQYPAEESASRLNNFNQA